MEKFWKLIIKECQLEEKLTVLENYWQLSTSIIKNSDKKN